MSWCDKLASTPTVGLRYAMNHQSSDSIVDALTPLLDTWVDGRKQRFTMEKQDTFSVQLGTEDGFQYAIDQARMSVEFRHRWKVKARSGGLPVAELTSQPQPFTELLPRVVDKVNEVAGLINGSRARVLDRIGIVSTTVVAENEAPPGILRFCKFINKPWNTTLDHFDIQITGQIETTDSYYDRCIHALTKSDDDTDKLLTIKLDWQRVFTPAKSTTNEVLRKYLSSAQAGALKYFEDVAEGVRFDEQLNSDPA